MIKRLRDVWAFIYGIPDAEIKSAGEAADVLQGVIDDLGDDPGYPLYQNEGQTLLRSGDIEITICHQPGEKQFITLNEKVIDIEQAQTIGRMLLRAVRIANEKDIAKEE